MNHNNIVTANFLKCGWEKIHSTMLISSIYTYRATVVCTPCSTTIAILPEIIVVIKAGFYGRSSVTCSLCVVQKGGRGGGGQGNNGYIN